MTFYVARETSKIWRRITTELTVELQHLSEKWKFILAGLIFQYIHGLAARGVHYLHRPGPYSKTSELGKERGYISESLFSFIFFHSFCYCFTMALLIMDLQVTHHLKWTFHPFIFHSKRFYTVLIWCRVLAFLVVSQVLRIFTFYSTQLPGPNYHCREGSKLAVLPRPENVMEVLLINFPRGVIYGCGDLIFSSHMIFTLVFVLTYQKYGSKRIIKHMAWLVAILQSLLIVASRKHYTVDVVVAWYTVNLVVFFVDRKLQEMPDRSVSSPGVLLPVSLRDKDENHRMLNGTSLETNDRRGRSQVNGKTLDDGAHLGSEPTMNGK